MKIRTTALSILALILYFRSPQSHASFINDVVRSVAAPTMLAPLSKAIQAAQPQQAKPTPPPVPPVSVPLVPAESREQLIQAIDTLDRTSTENAQTYSRIALTLVISALLLGIVAAIAGFCKASRLAGICSILATSAVAANNALPFKDEANTYKFVSAQAGALLSDARLNINMTNAVYLTYCQQLHDLATYGDQESVAGSQKDLESLLQQLHSATPASPAGPP